MKIAVVGPGAMGCLIAASLAERTKEEVLLIDKDLARAKALSQNAISIEGSGTAFKVNVTVSAHPPSAGVYDLIIICTKSYSTDDACRHIKNMAGEHTAILTLQNGIGNMQVLEEHFGEERVVGGVTNHGATLLETGRVRHAGIGDTIIGRLDGRMTSLLRTIREILTKAGFETKVSKDINSVIWSKLIINVGINALTAVTHLHNGMLIEDDGTHELLKNAVSEALRIAKRKRIKLVYDDPIQKCESVCKATTHNISSMLQDVLNKKRTEIDFINGAIVRQGKSLGIPTPVNEVLTRLVRTIESNYARQLSQKI